MSILKIKDQNNNWQSIPAMKGDPGVSPAVTVETIQGGHQVTITDATHPQGQSFNVMDGQGGGISDAPSDGKAYVRKDEEWVEADESAVVVEDDSTNSLSIGDENGSLIAYLDENGEWHFRKASHWQGKIWYAYGTSLTNTSSEGKYATYIDQLSGLTRTNKGQSGGGITKSSNQALYNAIMNTNDGKLNADLITVEVGANDGTAELGTVYDGLEGSAVTDNSTFCGALNLIIRYLQTNTNAQIVIIDSPVSRYSLNDSSNKYDGHQTFGSDQHTMFDRNEKIRQICLLNQCYHISCECNLGYARMNASNAYNVDNIHQTELGGYNFAQSVWARLKDIPLFFNTLPNI